MEKRVIVAKFLALVSFLIVSLLSIPFASAAVDFKILDDTLGQVHKILGMDAVVFGILVFLLFFLLYGIFALGLARSSLGGDNGRLNRNGKIIALSLAGVVVVSTFFVRTNVLAFAKNKLAPQFNMFFAVILSVLMFMLFRWMGKETFKEREDMANVFGIFAVGLALTMFGAIGAAKWAEGIGLTLIIISAIWLLVLMISGTGGDDRNRPTPDPPEPPPHPPGRATIYGVVVNAATGNAIEGAQVSTTIDGQQFTSTTNRNGAYRLYSMPQSDGVIVHATANGYEDRDSEVINLTEDRRVDFPMGDDLPQVRVQVLDQDTDPFTPIRNDDTKFLLTVPGNPMPIEVPGEHVHPQGNGIYILALLGDIPTPLTITAEVPGYHLVEGANIPDLAHPPHLSQILMTAGPGANEINVRVVDDAGTRIISPATRLRMGLPGSGSTNEIDPASIRDNGDGTYVIPEAVLNPVLLLGGGTTLTLGGRSPGHPDNDKAVNVDLGDIQPMYTIQLGGGGPLPPPPPGTFSITGNVTNENGDPVDGVRVELNAAHHTNTDAAGNYVIDNVPNAESGAAINLTIGCTDHQTRTATVGLNPDVANTHNFVIRRYTFTIIVRDVDSDEIAETINDPFNYTPPDLPPGRNYIIELEADPVNGRFNHAAPAAERTFDTPSIPGFATINFAIATDGNTAKLEGQFNVPEGIVGVDFDINIRMIDR